MVDVTCDLKPFNELRRAWLDKNSLPDSARAAVPPPLFPHGLLVVLHSIFYANDDPPTELSVGVPLERVSQIEFERCKTAFVRSE